MKRLLVFFAVVFAVSCFPLTAFADQTYHRPDQNRNAHHDKAWKDRHDREWHHHERKWAEHDREWKEHRGDRHWREVHAKKWNDWYRWHRENDDDFHLHIAVDNFELDIDR